MKRSAFAELEGAINGNAADDVEKPAPGFLTSHEWQQRWGLSLSRTFGKIAELEKAGRMERRCYRRPSSSGRLYPTPHYRLLPHAPHQA